MTEAMQAALQDARDIVEADDIYLRAPSGGEKDRAWERYKDEAAIKAALVARALLAREAQRNALIEECAKVAELDRLRARPSPREVALEKASRP